MIHPTADVSTHAEVGSNTYVWHHAHIREGVALGCNCIVGKDVYIDANVTIGDNVKIQNGAFIYHGVRIEDGVFVGPRACFTNDRFPRAITPTGLLKSADDWCVGSILVKYGASIGAGAIILPDVIIGRFAMIAAGSVVTHNVPDHGLVIGTPARLVGYVCRCGQRLQKNLECWECTSCQETFHLGAATL
ncbi:MAG: acyltransferase [Caldilineaceae bacterium]